MRSLIRCTKQHYVDSLAARPVSRASQHYFDRGLGYTQKILSGAQLAMWKSLI